MSLRLLSLLVVLLVGCEKGAVRSEAVTPGVQGDAPAAAKPDDPPEMSPDPAEPPSPEPVDPEPASGEGDCGGYAPGSSDVPSSLLACTSDDDCTLAQITCCPCSGNGRRAAVAKAHAACVKPGECQRPPVCAAAYVCDDYRAVCKDSVCTRVAANGAAEDLTD